MNKFVLLQIARMVVIVALLCVAAAIATPKGRLPLALRGLAKMLKGCGVEQPAGSPPSAQPPVQPSIWKRFLAFALVLLAVLLSLV